MPIEESITHIFQVRWSQILKVRDCLYSVKHGTNQSMLLLNGENDQRVLTLSMTMEALEAARREMAWCDAATMGRIDILKYAHRSPQVPLLKKRPSEYMHPNPI